MPAGKNRSHRRFYAFMETGECKEFMSLQEIHLFWTSPKSRFYTRRVTQVRFRELSSSVVSYAAQLVYTGKTVESYRLLSAADRLFRSLADPCIGDPAPLADELALAASFLEILRILTSLEIELVVELDDEARSASFVGCGSLVDAMDEVVAARAPAEDPLRIILLQDRNRRGRGLMLVAGDTRLPIPAGGDL
jgi:hypothetical protein